MAYLDYANGPGQRKVAEQLDKGIENASEIARIVGINDRTARKHKATILASAAKKEREHHFRATPEGFGIKRTSTNYNAQGEVTQQWVIRTPDEEAQLELMKKTIEVLSEEVKPAKPLPLSCEKLSSDLCNVYTLTDCHVGMLAWHREGGADWDLEIAEKMLVGAFAAMMDGAPPAETAIVAELGDFEHFDGYDAVTPTNRHQLDADGRFPKIIETSIRIRRSIIDSALRKHKHVFCVIAEGNHNIVSSMWMRKMFAALYADEPRVTIIDAEIPYYAHQFGDVMLGWHHGHKKKKEALPMLFASSFSKMWGDTKFRYVHTGHQHHMDIKEYSGCIVLQHQTLAARDAHASHGGYMAERSADCMTYHKRHGHVASNFVKPSMLSSC